MLNCCLELALQVCIFGYLTSREMSYTWRECSIDPTWWTTKMTANSEWYLQLASSFFPLRYHIIFIISIFWDTNVYNLFFHRFHKLATLVTKCGCNSLVVSPGTHEIQPSLICKVPESDQVDRTELCDAVCFFLNIATSAKQRGKGKVNARQICFEILRRRDRTQWREGTGGGTHYGQRQWTEWDERR